MGGCGIAYEYTLSKVSSDLLGNSVQQWAIVIALMLFFMGVGAEIQKRIQNERLIDALVGSQVILALLGGFGPLFLIQSFAFFPLHFSLVHYGLICSCGLLIGLEIPLITRLNETYAPEMRSNLGQVLRMDYAGALCGGLMWTFLLLPFFSISVMALILGLITLSCAILCVLAFHRRTHWSRGWLIILCLTILICCIGLRFSHQWALDAEQSLYRNKVVHSITSPYQRIILTESKDHKISCYINGHLQFSEEDEYIYHELLTHPAFLLNKRRQNILILGGGDGLALREVLKYPEVNSVTLVDLDPYMTNMAKRHPEVRRLNQNAFQDARVASLHVPATGTSESINIPPSPKQQRYVTSQKKQPTIELIHVDAAHFINKAIPNPKNAYDIAILDFPDPSSPELAKLYGLGFYGQLRQLLAPNAIIIQQSTSPWHARDTYTCIGRTLNAAGFVAIPLHANVPSFGDWGWWLATAEGGRSAKQLIQELRAQKAMPTKTRYLTPDTLKAATIFPPQSLSLEATDITTLNNPAAFKYYLHSWQNNQ